jgi:hypothetical protein
MDEAGKFREPPQKNDIAWVLSATRALTLSTSQM